MAKGKSARKGGDEAARDLAVQAARLADDANCEEIIILDLRGISQVTDYFVIASGTSGRQMRTVVDEIRKYGKSVGEKPWHVAGYDTGEWMLVDFVDVVVHVFSREFRHHYDLELIWGEAPRVGWREPAERRSQGE